MIDSLITAAPSGTGASFYRTSAGAGIGLVLTLPGCRPWVIEIKRSLVPKLERGFHLACEDITPQRRWVMYGGKETYPMAEQVKAISLTGLCERLAAHSLGR